MPPPGTAPAPTRCESAFGSQTSSAEAVDRARRKERAVLTVARWVTSGALPHVAVNGVRLIRPEQLEAFLAAHTEGDQLARQRHSSTRKRTA
jgi:hypothetical protein